VVQRWFYGKFGDMKLAGKGDSVSDLIVEVLLAYLTPELKMFFIAADDHETDYEFGAGSDDDDQIGDGEPRLHIIINDRQLHF